MLRSDENGMTLRVKLPQLQFVSEEGGGKTFTKLVAPGTETPGAPGAPGPALPGLGGHRVAVDDAPGARQTRGGPWAATLLTSVALGGSNQNVKPSSTPAGAAVTTLTRARVPAAHPPSASPGKTDTGDASVSRRAATPWRRRPRPPA